MVIACQTVTTRDKAFFGTEIWGTTKEKNWWWNHPLSPHVREDLGLAPCFSKGLWSRSRLWPCVACTQWPRKLLWWRWGFQNPKRVQTRKTTHHQYTYGSVYGLFGCSSRLQTPKNKITYIIVCYLWSTVVLTTLGRSLMSTCRQLWGHWKPVDAGDNLLQPWWGWRPNLRSDWGGCYTCAGEAIMYAYL